MKRHLTQADFDTIPPCPPDKRRIEYCDTGGTPGLYLEVRATSQTVGTAYLRYKNSAGKTAHQKLGTTQEITLKQARDKARLLKAEIALGNDPHRKAKEIKTVPTWNEFFAEYLAHVKNVNRSWVNALSMHRTRISERFGSHKLNEISLRDVEKFHSELLQIGLSQSTAHHHVKLLRRVLEVAVSWDAISVNPIAKIKIPAYDNQRERYLTDEELKRLMNVLKTYPNRSMSLLVTWLLATGSRKSESTAATWECIDYHNRVWIIESKMSKSKRRRSVPLNDVALSVLDELKASGRTTGHLFVGKQGPYRHLTKNWARICEAAGLQGLRLHDLRHSYASMLVNAGHSLFEVQQALGHSDPKITMRYSHLSKETLQKAADSAADKIKAAME